MRRVLSCTVQYNTSLSILERNRATKNHIMPNSGITPLPVLTLTPLA